MTEPRQIEKPKSARLPSFVREAEGSRYKCGRRVVRDLWSCGHGAQQCCTPTKTRPKTRAFSPRGRGKPPPLQSTETVWN